MAKAEARPAARAPAGGGSRAAPAAVLYLRVDFGEQGALGPGKVRLMELIAETGSISAAGRAMGMSYRRRVAVGATISTPPSASRSWPSRPVAVAAAGPC